MPPSWFYTLTYDQAASGIEAIDEIVSGTLHIRIDKYQFPGEAKMARKLIHEWAEATQKVQKRLTRFMTGDAALTAIELAELTQYMDETLGPGFGALVKDDIEPLLDKSYSKGKRQILIRQQLPLMIAAVDREAIEWLKDHHMFWIRQFYSRRLSKGITNIISDGLQQGLGRQAIGESLKEAFATYRGLGVQPDSYWRGLAANGMNRSRNFGEIQAFIEARITYYSLINPFDERTSDICNELVPKYQKVPVAVAVEQRDALMRVAEPEDVEAIAPWPRLEDIEGRSMKDLVAENIITPPFHFHCRTDLEAA